MNKLLAAGGLFVLGYVCAVFMAVADITNDFSASCSGTYAFFVSVYSSMVLTSFLP